MPHNLCSRRKAQKEYREENEMNSLSGFRPRGAGAVLRGVALVAIGLCWAVPALAEDVIRVASPYQTTTLDPMRSAAAGNIETYGQLYSRLLHRNSKRVRWSRGSPRNGKFHRTARPTRSICAMRSSRTVLRSRLPTWPSALTESGAIRSLLILRRLGPWNR